MVMNWKGFNRKRMWHNFKALCWHLPLGTAENQEKPLRIAGRRGRELNPGPPKYKEC
jgi:hypothetical protein